MYYFTCLNIITIINIISNTGKSSLGGLCLSKIFSRTVTDMYGERLLKKGNEVLQYSFSVWLLIISHFLDSWLNYKLVKLLVSKSFSQSVSQLVS